MASNPAGRLDRLSGLQSPRRKSHGRDRLRPPLRPRLLQSRLSRLYPLRPAAITLKSMGAPLLGFAPPSGTQSVSTIDLDALGAAVELLFVDSAAPYSRADWEREQQAEPTRQVTKRYIAIGRSPALPPDELSGPHSHQRPSFSEVQELAGKGRLHTMQEGIVLIYRKLIPPLLPGASRPVGPAACLLSFKPIRIFVHLLMHSRVMHACHSTASYHHSTTRTLRTLERLYWYIGMDFCTRRWLQN